MWFNLDYMYTMKKYHLLFILVFLFIAAMRSLKILRIKSTVSPDDAGQVDPSQGEFSPGEVVELTPTAKGYYEFEKWSNEELKIHFP